MSLYHIVFLGLAAGAVAEHVKKKTPRWLFFLLFAALTAILCLRFGQGTDYFSYASIYRYLPADPIAALDARNHSEPGWKFLCASFKMLGVSYPIFVSILSLAMMLLLLRFINRFCGERKLLALVILYHTFYMTYLMSTLRQGLVIAVFLGVMLSWLMERKYVRYCLLSVLLATLHSVGIVLLLLPVVNGIHLKVKHMVCLVVVGLLLGLVLSAVDIGVILRQFVDIYYLKESELSLVALLERIVSFGVVTFCYYLYLGGNEPEPGDRIHSIYKIYALGILLYGLLMWSPLISSRTIYVMKVVEVLLICVCISRCKKAGVIVLSYFLLLSGLLYVKNVDSYLDQGRYKNATVLDYPYVTIFNQKDILNYREDTISYPFESDDR